MTPPLAANQVAARLDRLPIGRFHRRFLALIALGAWFDYYDNFVAGTLAVALPRAGVLPDTESGEWISPLGLFMMALPLGMFLGTIFLGMATDRVGRRLGFVVLLLLYSLATLAGAVGYYPLAAVAGWTAGFVLLVVSRALAGAGIGAENVVIDAYVTELMPRQVRGRAVAAAHAFAFTALPVGALLALPLVNRERPWGWCVLLAIGSLGALLTWYFRRRLPESPRWLASVGRGAEAAAVLEDVEAAVERETGGTLPLVDVPPLPAPRRAPFRAIWSPAYRGRTLLLVAFQLLQTIGYYGFMHWLPTLLHDVKGFTTDSALRMQLTASLLAPVGPLLAVWSSERWQRKRLIVALALALAFALVAFGLTGQDVGLTLLAALIVVGNNWFSAVFHAYQAELFPTEARATGVGFTYAWSRASLAGLSLLMPAVIRTIPPAAFGLTAGAYLGVACIIGLFGPRTNDRPLEEIAG
jgi:putative MFS transporter